jgi:hypothetical protein
MQLLGIIVAALVIIAAAHAISGVIAFLLVLLIVWGLYMRPLETFGLFAFMLLSVLFQARPLACVVGLTFIAGLGLLAGQSSGMGRGTNPPDDDGP